MRKMLTTAVVEKTPPPAHGRLEIKDTIIPRLALRVTSNGARSFVVRTRVNGTQVRVTVGDARGLDLKTAREKASEILTKCRAGTNPREEKRIQLIETDRLEKLAVAHVVKDFIKRYASKNRTVLETQRIFDNDVLPYWRNKLITEVTRADVVAVLDRVEDRASPTRANRVLAAIRKMFNW